MPGCNLSQTHLGKGEEIDIDHLFIYLRTIVQLYNNIYHEMGNNKKLDKEELVQTYI